jgi:hypothetical protein
LFNAGLAAEEEGNLARACQLYMAARLATRTAFADGLYARGAGLRLLRVLAGRDEDAATAAAILVANAARVSDLEPLARLLLKRLDGEASEIEQWIGTILSVRYSPGSGHVSVELSADEAGEMRVVESEAPIGPFSAGDRVRVLMRRVSGRAAFAWRVVAVAGEQADGWQLMRVRALPGEHLQASK